MCGSASMHAWPASLHAATGRPHALKQRAACACASLQGQRCPAALPASDSHGLPTSDVSDRSCPAHSCVLLPLHAIFLLTCAQPAWVNHCQFCCYPCTIHSNAAPDTTEDNPQDPAARTTYVAPDSNRPVVSVGSRPEQPARLPGACNAITPPTNSTPVCCTHMHACSIGWTARCMRLHAAAQTHSRNGWRGVRQPLRQCCTCRL